ncbi:MAG: hypothetical protein OJF51_004453 [Nitrospira sp.]|nr:MAG: hypothetical protein OJF51_004453 [Nitrospira sp.]
MRALLPQTVRIRKGPPGSLAGVVTADDASSDTLLHLREQLAILGA